MPQKTFAGGLALRKNMKNTLLVGALLYLLSASDNAAPTASSKSAEVEVFRDVLKDGGEGPEMVVLTTGRFASPAASPGGLARPGSRFWAGCIMIKDELLRRKNL